MNFMYLNYGHRSYLRTYGLQIITEAVEEQLTIEECRAHLRLDAYGSPLTHPDDDWILDNLSTAREWCEFESGHALAPQIIELSLPCFPHAWMRSIGDDIRLPYGPIAGIEAVTYLDSGGNSVILDPATYVIDIGGEIGYIYPFINTCWPQTLDRPNAVKVRYHAGYTTPNGSPNDMPCPARYKSAMLLTLGHLYENRENSTELKLEELPLSAKNFLERNRLRMGFA